MSEEEIEEIEKFLAEIEFDPNKDEVLRLIRILEGFVNLHRGRHKEKN